VLTLVFHQSGKLLQDLDPQMRFQPTAAVGEDSSGGLDLTV
jgi:hypothetical protein